MSLIIDLYKSLSNEIDTNWYNKYKETVEQTGNVIDPNTNFTSETTDQRARISPSGLFKKLLKDHDNGIASAGQSYLTDAAFKNLKGSVDFTNALKVFKDNPGAETFNTLQEKLRDAIKDVKVVGVKQHPIPSLRLYRVAAACTTNVTPVVNETDFNRAYEWLINNVFENSPGEADETNWFTKKSLVG